MDAKIGSSAPINHITQDTVNKDQQAVKDAAKNGGDVKAAVAALVQDQAALNRATGTDSNATLAGAKDYMDQFLKKDGISTKGMDDAFADISHLTGPNGEMHKWGDAGSLDAFAKALGAQASIQQAQGDGLAAELKLEGNKGNLSPSNSTDVQNMKLSYQGWKASNPTKSVQDFAKQEAGKVGLSQNDIVAMVTDNAAGKGLDAQKALEGNKGNLSPTNQTDIDHMQLSYQGYLVDHPNTTPEAFAKQEAEKVGLKAEDIVGMIQSASMQKGMGSTGADPS